MLKVAGGSPAARVGLRGGTLPARIGEHDLVLGGDIVLSIMGIPVRQPDFPAAVREQGAAATPGQEVQVVVLREGRVVTLTSIVP